MEIDRVICKGGYYHVDDQSADNLYKVRRVEGISFYNVFPMLQKLPERAIIAVSNSQNFQVLRGYEKLLREHNALPEVFEVVASMPSRQKIEGDNSAS